MVAISGDAFRVARPGLPSEVVPLGWSSVIVNFIDFLGHRSLKHCFLILNGNTKVQNIYNFYFQKPKGTVSPEVNTTRLS